MIENENVEFKREYTENIKNSVTAFANTSGGKIYIGVDDNGQVLGVTDVDGTMLRLTNMLRDSIRPDVMMFVECKIETNNGKNVIVLTVQRGTGRPYYLHHKGVRPEGVYVRQGASSVPASENAILNMIKETSGDCYEDARSVNQQLTFQSTEAYFKKKKIPFGTAQKRSLNIISPDGTYSNLGMLLSDQCVHSMKLAVFDGSKKSIFRDRRELTGSLLSQLEEAYAYINQFNYTRAEFEGLDRIDQRDYPPEALREALLNAIVHRDYAVSGSTLISRFDDRIEVVTIGGLIHGISFDDIMLGVSVLRNKHLANVFYRLRLIEAYGTGILKINECYEDCQRKPKIEVSSNAFKLTLPNINYYGENSLSKTVLNDVFQMPVEKEKRAERITEMLKDGKTMKREDIEKELHISQSTAILLIHELQQKGVIQKVGNGKNTHYCLRKEPNA